MQRYIIRRLSLYIPTLLMASLMIFGIMRYLPGDVALIILGGDAEESMTFTGTAYENLRAQLGLDEPLPVQYGKWLWSMVSGEFGGESLQTDEPIRSMIARRVPVTLQLGALTLFIGLSVSLPMGVVAAVRQDKWADYVVRTAAYLGNAMPNFWVALLVILGLVTYFQWSPPVIYENLWDDPGVHLQIIIWPALVLSWGWTASIARMTRSTMLETLRQDYIRTARSKGLNERVVLWQHAMKNALIPVITVAGLQVESVLSGSLILENIFGVPGIGQGVVAAASARDYPVIQSLTMLLVFIALSINLLVDLAYAFVDPRIKYA